MRTAILLLGALALLPPSQAVEPTEYQLKAAFLYNFALFTEWPAGTGRTLRLCVHGQDPFGPALDDLQGKPVRHRRISIERQAKAGTLAQCQIVFISRSAAGELPATLEKLRNVPVLTVADMPGAARLGVMLNMEVRRNKVTFSANLGAARQAHLVLSSKLLGLATEVIL